MKIALVGSVCGVKCVVIILQLTVIAPVSGVSLILNHAGTADNGNVTIEEKYSTPVTLLFTTIALVTSG